MNNLAKYDSTTGAEITYTLQEAEVATDDLKFYTLTSSTVTPPASGTTYTGTIINNEITGEGKYIFEWTSDSIADANDLVNKAQLDEYLTNLTRIWMPWDGTTYLDIPHLLDYINWLYKWPNNIVRSESTYYSKMAEDQQKRAEIQADVHTKKQ